MATTPAGGNEGGYRPLAEINVTPLVDVMLVLLIIFMVTAPLMTVGVSVDLPKTSAPKASQPREPLIVSIDRTGEVYLGSDPLPASSMAADLAQKALSDPEAVVYVRGDRTVPYGRVMEIMGAVSQAGFARVSLLAHGSAEGAASSVGGR